MITKIIPTLPPQPLEKDHLQKLHKAAFLAFLRDIKGTEVDTRMKWVYTDEGGTYIHIPDYRNQKVWDRVNEIWESAEAKSLTDYLWSKGVGKNTMTSDRDEGISEDDWKRGWARHIWGALIHAPLLHLLRTQAIKDLSHTGKYCLWDVDHSDLDSTVLDLATRLCDKEQSLTVICPTRNLKYQQPADYEILPGVNLGNWSEEEWAYFFARHEEHYSQDLFAGMSFYNAFIRLNLKTPLHDDALWGGDIIKDHAYISEITVREIDQLKWACLVATNSLQAFMECPIIVTRPGGWKSDKCINRADGLGKQSYNLITLEDSHLTEISQLVSKFRKLTTTTSEIEFALWYFGRSCVTPLSRDALLDAVVGLEMILVPDAGESTYKFALHGSALLAGCLKEIATVLPGKVESVEGLEKELKGIYDLRSKAAHGAAKDKYKFEDKAPIARYLLAKSIQSVIELEERGELKITKTEGDIGKAVKNVVRERATMIRRKQRIKDNRHER